MSLVSICVSISLKFSVDLHHYSVKVLTSSKLALSLSVYIYIFSWPIFYSISILALLLILVHSFYAWDKNKTKDQFYPFFEKFINSSYPVGIALALEQAMESCHGNIDLLCEGIVQIVLKYPLGEFYSTFIHML